MKTISKNIIASLFVVISMFLGQTVSGALLSVDLDASGITVGDSVNFDINISGLGGGVAPSLSVYDLDILFDSGILQYQNIIFGDPVLGNQLDLFGLGSIQDVQELSGAVNVFELSLDNSADLLDFQADSFTLFSLNFNAIAAGTSEMSIDINALGDQLGDPLAASINNLDFSVANGSKVVMVPTLTEWGIFILSGLMMLCVATCSAKQKARKFY